MKINGNSSDPKIESSGVEKTRAAQKPAFSQVSPADAGGPVDTVQLSSQAQLAQRLRQAVAAGDTDAVRMDRVEQAKQKLADGKIGADPMALADRLIEHMLEG
jgi:flagellar biosynthesis anti-sigma factor FlgM